MGLPYAVAQTQVCGWWTKLDDIWRGFTELGDNLPWKKVAQHSDEAAKGGKIVLGTVDDVSAVGKAVRKLRADMDAMAEQANEFVERINAIRCINAIRSFSLRMVLACASVTSGSLRQAARRDRDYRHDSPRSAD